MSSKTVDEVKAIQDPETRMNVARSQWPNSADYADRLTANTESFPLASSDPEKVALCCPLFVALRIARYHPNNPLSYALQDVWGFSDRDTQRLLDKEIIELWCAEEPPEGKNLLEAARIDRLLQLLPQAMLSGSQPTDRVGYSVVAEMLNVAFHELAKTGYLSYIPEHHQKLWVDLWYDVVWGRLGQVFNESWNAFDAYMRYPEFRDVIGPIREDANLHALMTFAESVGDFEEIVRIFDQLTIPDEVKSQLAELFVSGEFEQRLSYGNSHLPGQALLAIEVLSAGEIAEFLASLVDKVTTTTTELLSVTARATPEVRDIFAAWVFDNSEHHVQFVVEGLNYEQARALLGKDPRFADLLTDSALAHHFSTADRAEKIQLLGTCKPWKKRYLLYVPSVIESDDDMRLIFEHATGLCGVILDRTHLHGVEGIERLYQLVRREVGDDLAWRTLESLAETFQGTLAQAVRTSVAATS